MPNFLRSLAVVCNGTVVSSSGQVCKVVNLFAYHADNVLGGGVINLFVAAFEANVWTPVTNLLSNAYVGHPYTVYFPARVIQGTGTAVGAGRNGQRAGPRLPLEMVVNASPRSALRGRNYRGLKCFSPLVAADVLGDELTPAAAAAWAAAVATFTATFDDGFGHVWTPFILSRDLTAPHFPVLEVVGADVTAVTLNKTIGARRHRRERTTR